MIRKIARPGWRRRVAVTAAVTVILWGAARAVVGKAADPSRAPLPAADGGDLIGSVAAPWQLSDWIGSPALTLASLRGKVVLVRWFTDTDCPYCTLTAPALNRLHRDYAARGLVVIGIYHHKRPEPLQLADVRGWVRDYGYTFPVAVDRDWRTLRRWWLDGHHRSFTSVSLLIDGHGVIRLVHPGGTLALGTADYDAMRAKIEETLEETLPR